MIWRGSCLLAAWLILSPATHAVDIDPGKDPVPSVMWAFYHKQMLGSAPFVFDERVKLLAPPFAEDARQVPLEIDARAFDPVIGCLEALTPGIQVIRPGMCALKARGPSRFYGSEPADR